MNDANRAPSLETATGDDVGTEAEADGETSFFRKREGGWLNKTVQQVKNLRMHNNNNNSNTDHYLMLTIPERLTYIHILLIIKISTWSPYMSENNYAEGTITDSGIRWRRQAFLLTATEPTNHKITSVSTRERCDRDERLKSQWNRNEHLNAPIRNHCEVRSRTLSQAHAILYRCVITVNWQDVTICTVSSKNGVVTSNKIVTLGGLFFA